MKRLTIFQINATVAAAGALALCMAIVLLRILPAILWASVLAIALGHHLNEYGGGILPGHGIA